MDSGLLISSKPCSLPTAGNLSWNKHSTNNIYYASPCASKASQQKRKTQIKYNVTRVQQPSLNNKWIEEGSTYQECNKKYVVKAVPVPAPSFDSEPHASDPKIILDSVKSFFATFYNFSYPYVIIGIILCAISSSLLTVDKLSDISPSFFIGVLQAVVPPVFIQIYSSAINQVVDCEIDKINKPYLPLASGQISLKSVTIAAASFLIMGFGFSWFTGSWPMIWNVILNTSIWTGYSINLPLFRWKRHPLLAAMCIVFSWAFMLPISSFLHMQTFVLKRPLVFPRSLIFHVAFMTFYSLGIALAKDIPDVEGDKKYGIDTIAVRLGKERVFWICVSLFEMAFGSAFLAGVTSSSLWVKIVTGLGHAILASVFWYQAKSIDFSNKASGGSFYTLIWKLLYAAYFLMALVR